MNQPNPTYIGEFPVNDSGLLLVNDLALIEALRRRAARKEAAQPPVGEARDTLKSS